MKRIAILYQANPVPSQDGIIKPMKKGGYSDSGADLAFALSKTKNTILTPVKSPNEMVDMDWVFPDTEEGINRAIAQNAEILWLNTVLYSGHPIQKFTNKEIQIVGQDPDVVEKFDNKWTTNQLLSQNNIPIPKSFMIHHEETNFGQNQLAFPLVLKPIRGRGSQGVSLVQDQAEFAINLKRLFESKLFGTSVYAESYLTGDEITITVMPPGTYSVRNKKKTIKEHWCLPVVKRFNHSKGIAPYSGKMAVIHNSKVLSVTEQNEENIQQVLLECVKAASLLNVKAPIRIDCRSDKTGKYYLFDLNLKPNMTGNIRRGRKDQNSLSTIAASAIAWSYTDFIRNILNQKWSL